LYICQTRTSELPDPSTSSFSEASSPLSTSTSESSTSEQKKSDAAASSAAAPPGLTAEKAAVWMRLSHPELFPKKANNSSDYAAGLKKQEDRSQRATGGPAAHIHVPATKGDVAQGKPAADDCIMRRAIRIVDQTTTLAEIKKRYGAMLNPEAVALLEQHSRGGCDACQHGKDRDDVVITLGYAHAKALYVGGKRVIDPLVHLVRASISPVSF